MAIGTAAGHPTYSGNFIPEVWAGQLNEKFYTATVFNDITNNKYAGEIKNAGDKVYIRTIPDITINDYVKGQVLDIEHPESPPIELVIDKAHYFNIAIDDIDAYQTDLALMEEWSKDATEQMRNKIDRIILADIYSDADSDNSGQTAGAKSSAYNLGYAENAVSVTADNVLDYLVDCGTVLDENDIPSEGRFFVAPAWFTNLIKKSDLQDASLSGDGTSILRNGKIGMIDRFTIYMSNNVNSGAGGGAQSGTTCWDLIFGHKSAVTYASQIVKVQNVTSERTFASLVRGLNVYGYKVLLPEALGHLYCYKG